MESPPKTPVLADNGVTIASVGERLVEGGAVFWQTALGSSGRRHPLSCTLLGFPLPIAAPGTL